MLDFRLVIACVESGLAHDGKVRLASAHACPSRYFDAVDGVKVVGRQGLLAAVVHGIVTGNPQAGLPAMQPLIAGDGLIAAVEPRAEVDVDAQTPLADVYGRCVCDWGGCRYDEKEGQSEIASLLIDLAVAHCQ